jgi:hypothetical protein
MARSGVPLIAYARGGYSKVTSLEGDVVSLRIDIASSTCPRIARFDAPVSQRVLSRHGVDAADAGLAANSQVTRLTLVRPGQCLQSSQGDIMRSLKLAAVLVALVAPALLTSGCAARVYSEPPPTGPAPYGPELVYAAPGVQVIADYDEPIFYADGFYWRWYGNQWYRSPYYTGGWTYYSSPPVVITRIQRPHTYAHYRPYGWRGRSAAPPARAAAPAAGPSRRGQATAPPPARPAPAPPSQTWRGHSPNPPPPAAAPHPGAGPSWRGRDHRGGGDRHDRR